MTTSRPWTRPLALLAATVIAASVTSSASADTKLRWKFVAGKSYQYKVTQKTSSKMTIQGRDLDQTITQDMDMTWEIKSVKPDGSAEMVQKIDRIKFMMDAPFGKVSIDTKDGKDPEGPMAAIGPIFRALAGAPVSLTMTPRGEIQDVKVPQELVDALKNAGPGAAAAGGMFSEEGLKNLVSQASLVLPEAAVAKGASWKSEKAIDTPPLGTMVMDNTYTYLGSEKGAEKIGLNLKITLKAKADSPVQVTIGDQANTGSFAFDNVAGLLKASSVTQKTKMTISTMGQEFVQDVTSETAMTLASPGTSR